MVVRHMDAGSCAAYLWENQELVLRATTAAEQNGVGEIKINSGDGVIGRAFKERIPVRLEKVDAGSLHTFDTNSRTGKLISFMAVPIFRGISDIGIIALNSRDNRNFDEQDELAIRAVASQLANIIENARFYVHLSSKSNTYLPSDQTAVKIADHYAGIPVTSGWASAPCLVWDRERSISRLLEMNFQDKHGPDDLKRAVEKTESELMDLQRAVEQKLEDSASLIFTSHLLMLKDRSLWGEVDQLIKEGEVPERALLRTGKRYADLFAHSANPYVRQKVDDIEDLVLRIEANLNAGASIMVSPRGKIIVARNLYPSEILTLAAEEAAGFILVGGGIATHASILARSLDIPLVLIDHPELMQLPQGTSIRMDANSGDIEIDPKGDKTEYVHQNRNKSTARKQIKTRPMGIVNTADGIRIRLMANINLLSDIVNAEKAGAEGIGLYRTEYPFLIRRDFPEEEEQLRIYKRAQELMPRKDFTFRTMDLGGDKILAYYQQYTESNPFLGLRSIRFSLEYIDIFKRQIRAILRASAGNTCRIMFPMISSLDEFLKAKTIVINCRDELVQEKYPIPADLKIGMMIELPSLIEIMEGLCGEADFFSIGTNDLVQYMLGVDRSNVKVAEYYIPHHPAILKSLARIVKTAAGYGKEISICGEMAFHERYIPFLLGIGIGTFSVAPIYLRDVQTFIGECNLEECRRFANELLNTQSIKEVERIMEHQRRQ